jgi:hypothetical protein
VHGFLLDILIMQQQKLVEILSMQRKNMFKLGDYALEMVIKPNYDPRYASRQ